ncbi:uncharacterized protein BDZ99DRAFT_508258 [Mytilinidion resinicola]|uniref:Proteasome assembly chaperone 3 n=1 Tax=Mytilinidion resinicola TaxID=574789 RepID=A0A6A6YS22_9PEZI|nr:uncharacterized protein BDZ99DRAFT_508258 [Mytilinidion resinicola]KAF2810765.1 hypothetical protein BDZ99DRAFT_508258 [Mytilinidion resinicola]
MAEAESYTVTSSPYPARTKTASASINSIPTTATSIYFADKIVLTVTQAGRLAHWLHVPLDTESPASEAPLEPSFTDPPDDENSAGPPSDLLPLSHLTATTVLGGTVPVLDTLGQLLATQIASAIATRDAAERRMVVVGLGLDKGLVGRGREGFAEVVGLVLGVL